MNSFQLYIRALALLGPEARLGWQLAIGNLLLAAAQFAEPVLLGGIFDALIAVPGRGSGTWAGIAPLLGAWVGFGLVIVICGALIAIYAGRLAQRQRYKVVTDYFEHVLKLRPNRQGTMRAATLMKTMQAGTEILWTLWLAFFREHFAAFVSLFVLLPLTLFLNWPLALLVIGLTIAFAFLIALVAHKTEALQRAADDSHGDLSERAADAIANVALVQSFARIDIEVAALRSATARVLSAQMPVLSWWAIATVLARSTTITAMLVMLPFGIWLHFRGQASIGEIIAFMSIAVLALGRLEQAVGFANRIRLDTPRLREFFGVFDTAPAVRDRLDAVDPRRVRGLIEFKDVSLSYDGKSSAVADLSFTALPGQIVALVGAPGAGKSTTLALLHRDFDPQSGTITIDGMDIRGIALAALRRNIGVVLRETALFNRTLGENLLIGRPEATEREMRSACKRAQITDLIEYSSEGFTTPVGERGRALSDDERQRLAIARVLLKDPPLLILDEAASAPDATTEARVETALNEVMKGRTTLVIARRRSTIRHADLVLMFENGRIVESGTYDELMQRGGPFAKLAETEFTAARKPSAPAHADRAATEG